MTHESASYDPPLIDWTRPRWMIGEGEMETARKLERAGLGRVYDDGDGGPVQWIPFESKGEKETMNPGDYVLITLFGLSYSGRINEVRRKVGSITYLVEYAKDGDILTKEFYGDEIALDASA